MSTAVNESGPADTSPAARRKVLKALSGLLLALFVSTLSSTVVSSALPKIIGAVHGSQTQYTWVVTATLLTTTATTPIWGKLADLFSKKTLVQVSIAVFVLGAVASGEPDRRRSSSPRGRCRASAWEACRPSSRSPSRR
jgi:putative Ca2+/H+ antiporter (TMEM165/GDT1 family)